jgi:hypothetical protein
MRIKKESCEKTNGESASILYDLKKTNGHMFGYNSNGTKA